MGIQHYKKEMLILDKAKSNNNITYFGKDVLGNDGASSLNVGIYEFFAGDKAAEFNIDNCDSVFYLIVGEIEVETNTGEQLHAEGGDIVFIPQKSNLAVRIQTIKYAKFFWVKNMK